MKLSSPTEETGSAKTNCGWIKNRLWPDIGLKKVCQMLQWRIFSTVGCLKVSRIYSLESLSLLKLNISGTNMINVK